jgi:hypothetical protein
MKYKECGKVVMTNYAFFVQCGNVIQSIIENGRGLLNTGVMEINLEVVPEIQESI